MHQTSASLLRLNYLQYVVELGFELKVRFGFYDGSFQGLLQHLDPSLGLLAGVRDAHVLPFASQPLLFGFVHLSEKHGGGGERRPGSQQTGGGKQSLVYLNAVTPF